MFTFKVHCRDKASHSNVIIYVQIPENSEKLAIVEAEKTGLLKARKVYFAGVSDAPQYKRNED